MIIAFFGVTCVGKTTIGKIISEELGYDFYDLDEQLKSYYNDTIENIQRSCFNRYAYDSKKADALKSIFDNCSNNTIIAMSPIYYTVKYKKMFKANNVVSIELQDSPERIAERMIFTDENDNIIEDYKSDIKKDIKEVKYYISHYKRAFSNIENKYNINGKSALEAANEIIDTIITRLQQDNEVMKN